MTAPWTIATILLPLGGAVACLLGRPAWGRRIRMAVAGGTLAAAGLVGYRVLVSGAVVELTLGGWPVPLGIRLYVDGLSALLLMTTAAIAVCITVYAEAYFRKEGGPGRLAFYWPLWFIMWAALNALFLSGDAFNLYVTLELMNLAAVALVALPRTEEALRASLRYLVIAFLGSLSYLFGVAMLYASLGTLDLHFMADRAVSDGPFLVASALILLGLMIKTALFPMHFWLPPAHANAPTPVSALLSGLVVTASAYMIIRFGFTVFAPLLETPLVNVIGLLGALAILWGSFHALLQERVKMVVAYSTVAQLGYIFLVFPLAGASPEAAAWAWHGVLYFAVCHACAKAAAFMAAGGLIKGLGHDRVAQLTGAAQRWPLVLFAFGVAGVNLVGLPPSGGFLGKWLMLQAAASTGRWDVLGIIVLGSLLAAGYIFRVLDRALLKPEGDEEPVPLARGLVVAPLLLALVPIVLGLLSRLPMALLGVGSPVGGVP